MRETVFSPSRKGQGFCAVPGIQEGQLAARVGEPVIDVIDVIFLHHFEDFLGIGHVSRFPVFDV